MKLRIPPLVQFLLCGGLGWGLALSMSFLSFSSPLLVIAGVGFIGLGVILLAASVGAFARAGTTVDPLHPERAEHLVTTGLYRFSRNPMYLAMALVLTGGAAIIGNVSAFLAPVVFVGLMNELQIKPEERELKKTFGSTFEAYRRQTRRWL